ncbi:MAG TPA: hypothetical protein VE981_00150 [Planctomycetota bacterium]|nr:hypothetical protein [Planctomycetota bacterium]
MKRLALILALPVLASCSDQNYYAEEFSLYYDRPATETKSVRIEKKEIVYWAKNPREKKRIGFLTQMETKVVGSRTYRNCWYIWDPLEKTRVGFITDEGEFYRFDAYGRFGERVGEYKVTPTGLKIFYGIPLEEHVEVEDIDPYK